MFYKNKCQITAKQNIVCVSTSMPKTSQLYIVLDRRNKTKQYHFFSIDHTYHITNASAPPIAP